MANGLSKEVAEFRKADYKINSLILNRWSSRSMSGEGLSDKELMPLFEAARWAPSGMNNQLWRFIYAKKGTKYFSEFLDLLHEGNKSWCINASVLVILISRKNSYHNDVNQRTHSMESGAAFENLAIEGISRGLVVHPLAGFDIDKTRNMLHLTDVWDVECMIAVGKKGKKEDLPPDLLKREKPSIRKPLNEIVFEGFFNET